MDWRAVFFQQHAGTHGAAVGSEAAVRYEDVVLGGLSDAQMRLRPADDQNSLAWLIWHMARCEDVAVNVAIAGQDPVFEEGWAAKLGVERADIGTGMTPSEVADLSERIDLDALMSYRHAVGRQTRDVIATIDDERLQAPVDPERYRRAEVLGDHAGWVDGVWAPWRGTDFLYLATGHSYQHWGEAITVRALGGFSLGL